MIPRFGAALRQKRHPEGMVLPGVVYIDPNKRDFLKIRFGYDMLDTVAQDERLV